MQKKASTESKSVMQPERIVPEEDSNLINLGKNCYYKSEFDDCIEILSKYQEKNRVSDKECILYIGLSYYQLGNSAKAAQVMEPVIDSIQIHDIERYDLIILINHYFQLHYENNHYATQHKYYLYQICQLYLKQMKFKHPESSSEWLGIYLWGMSLFQYLSKNMYSRPYKKKHSSEYMLSKAIHLEPSFVQELHLLLACVYINRSQPKQAKQQYKRVLQINPTNFEAQSNIGFIYNSLSKIPKAIQAYEKAMSLNTKNVVNLHNLALNHQRTSKRDKTEEVANLCIEIAPLDPRGYILLANSNFLHSEYDKALTVVTRGRSVSPNSHELYILQSQILASKNNYEPAAVVLKEAAEVCELKGNIFFEMGILYQKQGIEYSQFQKYLRMSLDFPRSIETTKIFDTLIQNALNQKHADDHSHFTKLLISQRENPFSTSQNTNQVIKIMNIYGNGYFDFNGFTYYLDAVQANNTFAESAVLLYRRTDFPNLLQTHLNIKQIILSYLAFSKSVAPKLTFNTSHTFWDLYLD